MNATRTKKLVVFEGGDNVGKSTIIENLAQRIEQQGKRVEVLAFPGNKPGTLGKWVYDYHHAPQTAKADQTSLQMLHVAAHLDCIESQIKPLLEQGCFVILDRFWWSTWVYGIAGGVSEANLTRMISIEKDYWSEVLPSCLFWIRRKETEADPFQQKICAEYGRLAETESRSHSVFEIHNDSTVEAALEIAERQLTLIGLLK